MRWQESRSERVWPSQLRTNQRLWLHIGTKQLVKSHSLNPASSAETRNPQRHWCICYSVTVTPVTFTPFTGGSVTGSFATVSGSVTFTSVSDIPVSAGLVSVTGGSATDGSATDGSVTGTSVTGDSVTGGSVPVTAGSVTVRSITSASVTVTSITGGSVTEARHVFRGLVCGWPRGPCRSRSGRSGVVTSVQASAQHAPLTDASWETGCRSGDLSAGPAALDLGAATVAELGAQSQ